MGEPYLQNANTNPVKKGMEKTMRTLELVQPFFYLIWILKFLGVFLLVM